MTQWMMINQLEGTAVWFNLTDCPFFLCSACLFFLQLCQLRWELPPWLWIPWLNHFFSFESFIWQSRLLPLFGTIVKQPGERGPHKGLKTQNTSQQNKHNTTPNTQRLDRCLLRPASMDEASSRVRGRSYAATCATNGCTGATWAKQICSLDGWFWF